MSAQLTEQACPRCGRTITVDSRFVTWCEFCDWNIDPAGKESPTRREVQARRKGEALFAQLRQSPLTKPGRSAARVAAFAIALAIHSLTIAILGLGVYILVTNFGTFFGFVVGGFAILLGVLIRPRLGGIRSGTVLLPRDSAPALYGLTDRIGGEMGARPIDVIALDSTFNAGHGQVGIRRERVLWIGLPLWNVLDDEQRVALLAHELAHQVNGDLAFGLVVGAAMRTLGEWHELLRAGRWQPGGGSVFAFLEMLGQLLARAIYRVLRAGIDVIFRIEEALLFRSGQRAEYFADRLAAQIGSTEALLACLDVLHLARACSLALRFAARREANDLWETERAFFRDFSPKEWERLRRLDARRGTSVDSTHPPTNLRITLLQAAPPAPGRMKISTDEAAAISNEIESGFRLVAEQMTSRFAS